MKARTLKNRIEENLMTKSGEIRQRYEYVMTVIENPSKKHHLTYWRRSGRNQNLVDRLTPTAEGLRLIGIDYETGNDAPRGGQEGNYITLTAKGRRQVAEFLKSI